MTYLAIFFILLFVFFFACGLGSVPFFLPNELFPSCAQGAANSIAIASNWMFNFCVTVSFLGVQVSFCFEFFKLKCASCLETFGRIHIPHFCRILSFCFCIHPNVCSGDKCKIFDCFCFKV